MSHAILTVIDQGLAHGVASGREFNDRLEFGRDRRQVRRSGDLGFERYGLLVLILEESVANEALMLRAVRWPMEVEPFVTSLRVNEATSSWPSPVRSALAPHHRRRGVQAVVRRAHRQFIPLAMDPVVRATSLGNFRPRNERLAESSGRDLPASDR